MQDTVEFFSLKPRTQRRRRPAARFFSFSLTAAIRTVAVDNTHTRSGCAQAFQHKSYPQNQILRQGNVRYRGGEKRKIPMDFLVLFSVGFWLCGWGGGFQAEEFVIGLQLPDPSDELFDPGVEFFDLRLVFVSFRWGVG